MAKDQAKDAAYYVTNAGTASCEPTHLPLAQLEDEKKSLLLGRTGKEKEK